MSKFRFLLSVGLSVVLVVWLVHFATNHLNPSGGLTGHTISATQQPSALIRALRPSYPYSIIPGGAYSPRELQYADGNDDLVRAHYADFDVKNAKLVTLTDDRYQYVSYRLNNRVYWTRKKLRIPKGELLLTDGGSYARARCGNRLSDLPHTDATTAHEPDTRALTLPPITPQMLPSLTLAQPPALDAPVTLALPESQSGAEASAEPSLPSLASIQSAAHSENALTGFAPMPNGLSPIGSGGAPFLPVSPSPTAGSTSTASAPGAPASTGSIPPVASSLTPPIPNSVPSASMPTDPTPIPEPNTVYLFVAMLVISLFVLARSVFQNQSMEEPPSTDSSEGSSGS